VPTAHLLDARYDGAFRTENGPALADMAARVTAEAWHTSAGRRLKRLLNRFGWKPT
jgi:hypothetical protein